MSNRTGMLARAYRGKRMMAHGPSATVYLLGPDLALLASTESAHEQREDDGRVRLVVTEGGDITPSLLNRTFVVVFASGTDTTLYQWRKVGNAKRVGMGQALREWALEVAPTGNTWSADVVFSLLLETGDALLLESGDELLLEAA